ncbi:uncharacterized protein LOC125056573 [Pieris napi]|uniref:uncharacterized protein LOC125056573 n=1 Tax=Pieris napi TaxID=78633 RepID=UPI001FBA3696|nr:uncharacterized protein LOC125056573 [Pieris napi]
MNKFQRRLYRYPRKDYKYKEHEVEEVFPPKPPKNVFNCEKPMTNRCCSVAPDVVDATEQCVEEADEDLYQNLLIEQYGFDPRNLSTIDQLKEIKKLICGETPKVETASQYNPIENKKLSFMEAEYGFKWQDIDNTEDIDNFFVTERNETYSSDEVKISEVPKVKVIAEKFMKFKKDNIEVRRLDEKVVCVEYDVYKKHTNNGGLPSEPIQKLRTYYSVKPVEAQDACIPSSVRLKYKIASEDLKNLTDKEVEIIDGKISDNQTYLDDLRKVLIRKEAHEKKNKTVLDLMSLYKLAKRNLAFDDDVISKVELEEIKELITKNCASSIHGISRRTIKSEKDESKRGKTINAVSESIFTEILRNVEDRISKKSNIL